VARTAAGTFDVTVEDETYDDAEGATLQRSVGRKEFRGDLVGTSRVDMVKAVSGVPGSAGYVGIERITGTLDGRTGSFVVQHHGLLDRGAAELSIQVVPDTGTGELSGITGTMTITVVDGDHRFTIDYTVPAA
jgi:hypothetical protein